MSYNTYKNWFYQLHGRYIHLWQLANNAFIDTIGSYKIRLPGEKSSIQLIYPDEDITNGLRIEYTSFDESEIFISEALESTTAKASGTDISFALSGTRITTDNTNNFWDTTSGFAVGDKIRVIGSASNDADYTIDSFSGTGNSNMVVSGSTLTDENVGESITIYQIPKTGATADESAHVNLNRMLSLAVVDYMKAQQKELEGDIQGKEYYIKQFWKKVADDQSNKRNISMTFSLPVYSVR
tara:strand:+ start:6672 stop:7391 length:720 start_codon:yes stop_codon:yes gene_type:complete